MEAQQTLIGTVTEIRTKDGFAVAIEHKTMKEYMIFLYQIPANVPFDINQRISFTRDTDYITLVAQNIQACWFKS